MKRRWQAVSYPLQTAGQVEIYAPFSIALSLKFCWLREVGEESCRSSASLEISARWTLCLGGFCKVKNIKLTIFTPLMNLAVSQFAHMLMYLSSLYCKQHGPRTDSESSANVRTTN